MKFLAVLAVLAPDVALAHCRCHHHHMRHVRRVAHRHHWGERVRVLRGAYHDCDNYPRSALVDRATGVTLLKVRVDDDGRVRSSAIRRSSGRADLDRAAKACVAHWHFPDAATVDWRTVRVAWRIHRG